MKRFHRLLLFVVISGFVGLVFEFVLGWIIYFLAGNFMWVYPESNLITTSIYTIPFWMVAGFIFYAIGITLKRKLRHT